VGTTWIGLVTPEGEWARKFVWEGDRRRNKELSVDAALELVMDYLRGALE
jgi:nicotinamide mononucleotide (NMN) deamidase PncC